MNIDAVIATGSPLDKKGIISLAQSNAQALVEGGLVDPLSQFVKVKRTMEYLTAYGEGIKKAAQEEAEKHGKGGAKIMGAKIEVVEAGTSYDFSGDYRWLELKAIQDEATKKLKDREALLKTLKEPIQELTTEGEVQVVPVPVKSSTTTIKVTL